MTLQAPDLSESAVTRVVAGIRPCRAGGLRIETERVAGKDVVHHYGHGGSGVTTSLGSAQIAADLVENSSDLNPSPARAGEVDRRAGRRGSAVGVLGGGVVALATARELLKRGHTVTCYAEKFVNETTSNIAGALWLPTGVEFGSAPDEPGGFLDILRRAQAELRTLDPGAWSYERLPVYEPAYAPHEDRFFDNGTIDTPEPLERLPVAGPPRAGRVFWSDFIHTPAFLRALAGDVEYCGGRMETRRFERLDDLAALPERVLVNCLALGSRVLFGDEAVYPARGVLVHLRPQALGYIVHDGYRYMFPREDALILGGTFEPGREDTEGVDHVAAEILSHHRRFFGGL